MRKCIVQSAAPVRLSQWMRASFPAVTKSLFVSTLRKRDIRVNGKRVGEDAELHHGDEVALYIPDESLDGPLPQVVWFSESLVVAVKPQGIVSKAEGEADMECQVGLWLEKNGEAPFVLACHRLDSQTGGLMIFARSAETEAAVRAMMEAGKIVKTYNCIVKGVPKPAHAVLTAYLKKDAKESYVTVFDKPVPGARTAVTEYTVLKTDGLRSLLEVRLHTGRTHQIRAQMAHIGHPILGDDKYGDRAFNKDFKARRQKLWAAQLEFNFEVQDCPALQGLSHKELVSTAPFLDDINESQPK
jgi:23S rRNA pseudouridine955/2504/2580 synthase